MRFALRLIGMIRMAGDFQPPVLRMMAWQMSAAIMFCAGKSSLDVLFLCESGIWVQVSEAIWWWQKMASMVLEASAAFE